MSAGLSQPLGELPLLRLAELLERIRAHWFVQISPNGHNSSLPWVACSISEKEDAEGASADQRRFHLGG